MPHTIPQHLRRVKNIVNGAAAAVTGDNQALHDKRLALCKACPRFLPKLGGVCAICGCALNLKLRVKKEHCPAEIPKW